jgi:hypothetical protein
MKPRMPEGSISAADVEDWANAVEGREDVGREAGYESLLNDAIFELANPMLHEPLTREHKDRLSARLLEPKAAID